jgi:hypothetical protein
MHFFKCVTLESLNASWGTTIFQTFPGTKGVPSAYSVVERLWNGKLDWVRPAWLPYSRTKDYAQSSFTRFTYLLSSLKFSSLALAVPPKYDALISLWGKREPSKRIEHAIKSN